jgi:hypothetical protein
VLKKPSDMTASEINKALDRVERAQSKIAQKFIAKGRGNERPMDWLWKADLLSQSAQKAYDEYKQLRREVERRYGPNPPHRLPVRVQKTLRANPTPRADVSGAAKLAERFHGRAPEFEDTYEKPTIPDAMANIGAIYAIEYLAERDGKEYRFRHVFKQKSRPQLAVAPDGKFVTMIGGSWRFTEDGFEDS